MLEGEKNKERAKRTKKKNTQKRRKKEYASQHPIAAQAIEDNIQLNHVC